MLDLPFVSFARSTQPLHRGRRHNFLEQMLLGTSRSGVHGHLTMIMDSRMLPCVARGSTARPVVISIWLVSRNTAKR